MDAPVTDVPRCAATAKQSGQRCKRRPVPGGRVCVIHGGAAPAVRAAAERRRVEAEATALLELIWDPDAQPVTDPVSALQRLAGRLEHAVNVLGAMLEGADLKGGVAVAWSRVLRELRQALIGMERLNLAERHVELEADRVRLVAMALGRVFDVLELDVEQRQIATRVLLEELRAAEARQEITVVKGDAQ